MKPGKPLLEEKQPTKLKPSSVPVAAGSGNQVPMVGLSGVVAVVSVWRVVS